MTNARQASPRLPRSGEEHLYKKIVSLGRKTGDQYPKVWDGFDTIIAAVSRRVHPVADALVGTANGLRSMKIAHITNTALFALGFALFILFVTLAGPSSDIYSAAYDPTLKPSSDAAMGWWMFVSLLWITSLIVTAFSVYKRGAAEISERRTWLRSVGANAAFETILRRRTEASLHIPGQQDRSIPFIPKGATPSPQPYGVSHEGAERLCAEWMRYLGEEDAEATRFVSDGGIDVTSLHYVAQVKNYAGSVGVASIRDLAGVVSDDGRKPLFFTSGTYASGSIDFANRVQMPLFVYDASEGSLHSANALAEAIFQRGL